MCAGMTSEVAYHVSGARVRLGHAPEDKGFVVIVQFVYLSVIMLVAFVCPYVASLVPGKPIPGVVFLVFAGAIIGQNGLGLIDTTYSAIQMLSQLGLGFLFLLAGYELDPRQLTGRMGLHAAASWGISLVMALVITAFLPIRGLEGAGTLAFAVAMTTTAFGTLAPILRERGITGTPVGQAVTVYGAMGELLPVIAMAFLLSSRSAWLTAVILGVFGFVCLRVAKLPGRARARGSKVIDFLQDNAETGSQATVRLTVALLVFLVALSAAFDLDIVLGAFAAGFILRHASPEGDRSLETKLEGIGNGFLVPVFFVVSGASINLAAATARPLLLLGFMALLLLVRALPVGVALSVSPETRDLTAAERLSVSIYCTMALPLIVAVTTVASDNGAMSSEMASVLVTAGACTVLVVPVVTSLVWRVAAAHPIVAIGQIAREPRHLATIVHAHGHEAAMARHEFHRLRDGCDELVSPTDYLARRDELLAQEETPSTEADGDVG
jgi:Kef-type K+ transport system membrane component KefB